MQTTPAIHVHIGSQTLRLVPTGEGAERIYPISTSRFGPGTEPGSYRTPTGRFVVREKHGDGLPPGEILISRVPTGRLGREEDEHDHVQTRLLWLHGLEAQNANTFSRYIYIHGTNAESRLGTPASFGCIRMGNQDVIELYEHVPVGTPVFISAEEGAESGAAV